MMSTQVRALNDVTQAFQQQANQSSPAARNECPRLSVCLSENTNGGSLSPEVRSPLTIRDGSASPVATFQHNPYGGWKCLPEEGTPMANAPRGSPYVSKAKEQRMARLVQMQHQAMMQQVMLAHAMALQQQQQQHAVIPPSPAVSHIGHHPVGVPAPRLTILHDELSMSISTDNSPLNTPTLPPMPMKPSATESPLPAEEPLDPELEAAIAAPIITDSVCRCLVQFKCHQAEYASPIELSKGQYVAVQGDRGIDIGFVVRVNTDAERSYIERSGPTGNVLRRATQQEVDYWSNELKNDENLALDFCRQRVARHQLPMDVRHAEYQYDKKKLTFYYDSKQRVDFVNLCKELYREYGCRIWMEKVRGVHE